MQKQCDLQLPRVNKMVMIPQCTHERQRRGYPFLHAKVKYKRKT